MIFIHSAIVLVLICFFCFVFESLCFRSFFPLFFAWVSSSTAIFSRLSSFFSSVAGMYSNQVGGQEHRGAKAPSATTATGAGGGVGVAAGLAAVAAVVVPAATAVAGAAAALDDDEEVVVAVAAAGAAVAVAAGGVGITPVGTLRSPVSPMRRLGWMERDRVYMKGNQYQYWRKSTMPTTEDWRRKPQRELSVVCVNRGGGRGV